MKTSEKIVGKFELNHLKYTNLGVTQALFDS